MNDISLYPYGDGTARAAEMSPSVLTPTAGQRLLSQSVQKINNTLVKPRS